MTKIGVFYGTAFELSNSFDLLGTCYEDGFCWQYGDAVFGGANNGVAGGIFYNTIFIQDPVLGLTKFSSEKYRDRNECFTKQTCGRGIGVYKYDDIFGTLKITKKDSSTNEVISGAGFTLYKDSSCRTVVRPQIETNSNGIAIFGGLDAGTYYYKETTVPDGYSGDINCNKAVITRGNQKEFIVTNTKHPNKGKLQIKVHKYPNEDDLITSRSTEIEIFEGSNCSGAAIKTIYVRGWDNFSLNAGNYSIKVKEGPGSPYVEVSGETYTCQPFNISASQTTTVKYPYTTSCESELTSLKADGYTLEDALTLYNKYEDSKASLFDLNNPSCSRAVDCDGGLNSGCLMVQSTPILRPTNLSCANITGDGINRATTFCYEHFNLSSDIYGNTFNTKSGQFLIKKINKNDVGYYSWYDENWIKREKSVDKGVAKVRLTQTCFTTNSTASFSTPNAPKVYFGDNNKPLSLIKSEEVNEHWSVINVDGLNKIQHSYAYYYDFNEVNIEGISGKIVSASSNTTKSVQGLLVNFNKVARNEPLPFKVEFNGEYIPIAEDSCKYNTEQEIIKYPPGTDGKLDLEFRIVDTKNPFNRRTMSNWSDVLDNSSNNNIVIRYIKEAVNSYGIDKYGNYNPPKYKITLTPNDIKQIRRYNKTNPYNNYLIKEVTYRGNRILRNSFLYNLEKGKLNNKNLTSKLYNSEFPI